MVFDEHDKQWFLLDSLQILKFGKKTLIWVMDSGGINLWSLLDLSVLLNSKFQSLLYLYICSLCNHQLHVWDTWNTGYGGSVLSMQPLLVSKVFLSLTIRSRISVCTSKQRFLWGPRDVGSDSLHTVTVLSLHVVTFPMLGSMWHSTLYVKILVRRSL